MLSNRNLRARRRGFTVAELLVVIAIIGVLAALTASAVFSLISGQSLKNTKLVLQKTEGALQLQWSKVASQASGSEPPPSVLNMAGGDRRIAQAIWVKLQLKRHFPMSYAEALQPWAGSQFLGPGDLPPIPDYVMRLKGKKSNDPITESAACLLMALQYPRSGLKFNAEAALGASALGDTDGDGLPEIVDGWGKPVLFFRWASFHPEVHALGSGKTPLDQDTEDPEHALMNSSWNPAHPGVADFERLCHPITSWDVTALKQQQPAQPRSYYTLPVIVSMGKDGKHGLYWWMSVRDTVEAKDNIYSFKVR